MRRPRLFRSLNLLLALLAAAGLVLSSLYYHPDIFPVTGGTAITILLICGVATCVYHGQVKRLNSLLDGNDILARWTVDHALWLQFLELNSRLNAQPSRPRYIPPPGNKPHGVQVIISKTSALVDDDFHTLIDAGDADYGPFWIEGPPPCIEFQFRLPTEPQEDYRTAFRIPIAPGHEPAAIEVFNFYKRLRTPSPTPSTPRSP